MERRNPRNMKYEYVLPSTWWTETVDSHRLLLHVPGFKKDEVRIRTDSQGHVIVSGEREANDNTILHFEQAYKVPEGCNIEETNAILEDETYYITIPKKNDSKVENSIPDSAQGDLKAQDSPSDSAEENTNENDSKGERPESSFLQKMSEMMKTGRCLVLTSLLAFSLGVFVSHHYHSTPQKDNKKRAADDAKKDGVFPNFLKRERAKNIPGMQQKQHQIEDLLI